MHGSSPTRTLVAWQPGGAGGSGEERAARQEETNGNRSKSAYMAHPRRQRCTLKLCVCACAFVCVCVSMSVYSSFNLLNGCKSRVTLRVLGMHVLLVQLICGF